MGEVKTIIAHKDPSLPPPLQIPDGPDWVTALSVLAPHDGETLYAATRTLYPHDRLPARAYRRVVAIFDRLAKASPDVAERLAECIALLDSGFPVPFCARSEGYRIAALEAIETTPAFRLLQRLTVRYLYDDVEVWAAFGYEGASFHLGGYVERGFDDLDWLPELPQEI
jgi:hypothetical protein